MKQMMIGFAVAALAAGVGHAQEAKAQEAKIAAGFIKAPLESRTLRGAPYSAEIVSDFVQTLSDGNRIVRRSTGRVYRDSEGRVRREEDRASGAPSISITDPVSGFSYSLDPDTHIAWKTPALAGAIIMSKVAGVSAKLEAKIAASGVETRALEPTMVGPDGATTVEINGGAFSVRRSNDGVQGGAEALPAKVIAGVIADGKRTTKTIPAGAIGNERAMTITVEEWTSPELQVLVLTEHKDPRAGDSSYRLVNVTRNEPAASLFEVPADYTIKETGIKRFERQQ
jgi:hypothetical protein